jgi:hypothetical protein
MAVQMIVGERRSGPADLTTVPTAPVEAAHAVEQVPRYCTASAEKRTGGASNLM